MSNPPPADESATPDWPDMDPEEQAEIRAAFDEAEAEYQRGESLPAEEVLPRYRRAG